jgi:hypothetical protein
MIHDLVVLNGPKKQEQENGKNKYEVYSDAEREVQQILLDFKLP